MSPSFLFLDNRTDNRRGGGDHREYSREDQRESRVQQILHLPGERHQLRCRSRQHEKNENFRHRE